MDDLQKQILQNFNGKDTQKLSVLRKEKGYFPLLCFVISVCILAIMFLIFRFHAQSEVVYEEEKILSNEVEEYTPIIEYYASKESITAYVPLIQAVMMQESNGLGNDPMQASECEYNKRYPQKPNGIENSEYSIEVGIKYLSVCLKEADVHNPDDLPRIRLALQGYNYGTGYIFWAIQEHGGYSEENVKEFAQMMMKNLGWQSYGDESYANHVLQYYIYA